MCLLCDDERAYQAYMDYLDATERAGQEANPDLAMQTVFEHLKQADKGRMDAPENDKTLSPFFCSPVNK